MKTKQIFFFAVLPFCAALAAARPKPVKPVAHPGIPAAPPLPAPAPEFHYRCPKHGDIGESVLVVNLKDSRTLYCGLCYKEFLDKNITKIMEVTQPSSPGKK